MRTVLVAAVFGTLGAAGVHAQDSNPPNATPVAEAPIEEVVITGSRIRQDAQSFANPVTSFSAETLAQSGKTNLTDFLTQSPALVGSITGERTAGSIPGFGEVGLNLLDLRHLGVDRTLV